MNTMPHQHANGVNASAISAAAAAIPYDMSHAGPSSGAVPGTDWPTTGYVPPPAAGFRSEGVQTDGFSANDMPDDPNWSRELVFSK
jgi:hypothetical protein